MRNSVVLLICFAYSSLLISPIKLEVSIQTTDLPSTSETVAEGTEITSQSTIHEDISTVVTTPPVPAATPSSTLPKVVNNLPNPATTSPDPATADVCGLSLVSPNSENDVKQQKCKCSDLDEDIDCSNLGVTQLPKLISFPKSARHVYFVGNKIGTIAEDTFYNGRNVREMDLSQNNIDFISSLAFKPFKSLRTLNLGHNDIWNIPYKSFQGLTQIRILDLSYNKLILLSSEVFSETKDLRVLNLESNPLTELEPKTFEHLPHLEVLNLESTLLKVIPDHLFVFTPKLQRLDLSNNLLTDVPTDALNVLDHLKVLELSGNPIHIIQGEAFLGMRGLVILYLNSMPDLIKIEKYAFGDLQQLHELHCSYNFLLAEIDEYAFVRKVDNKKISLSQLFLEQNSLTTIPKNLLNWDDSVELHIGENPLYCDCNAEWLVNLKIKNDFQNRAKCNLPSHLSDMSLSSLKNHNLSCGMEFTEIIMIVVAVVAFLCILAFIVAFVVWKRGFSGYRKPYWKVSKGGNVQDIEYGDDDDM